MGNDKGYFSPPLIPGAHRTYSAANQNGRLAMVQPQDDEECALASAGKVEDTGFQGKRRAGHFPNEGDSKDQKFYDAYNLQQYFFYKNHLAPNQTVRKICLKCADSVGHCMDEPRRCPLYQHQLVAQPMNADPGCYRSCSGSAD